MKKLSLTNAEGFKQLIKLRNEAVAAMTAAECQVVGKAEALFGTPAQVKK